MLLREIRLNSLLISLIIFHSSLLFANNGLNYLNTLRVKAGLPPFKENSILNEAAYNHAYYLRINNTQGHDEVKGLKGFTGERPVDRAFYSGYNSSFIIENISYFQKSYTKSIDKLFSAIYHRLGFLNLNVDEIGIGRSKTYYNYDMGNSYINKLCEGDSYNKAGKYINICRDSSKKIEYKKFEEAKDFYKKDIPKLVLWPPENSDFISPLFEMSETPSPLPSNVGMSGYPISVIFNDKKSDLKNLTIKDFTLTDSSGKKIEKITLLSSKNDPNKIFKSGEYAFFPKNRLDWGKKYYANISYIENGNSYNKKWCFSTKSLKSLADRYYELKNYNNKEIPVISGKSYAIYLVPENDNDKINSWNVKYNVSNVKNDFIDFNTLILKVTGEVGNFVEYSFSNGKKLKFVISETDEATEPLEERCLVDDNSQSTPQEIISKVKESLKIPQSVTKDINLPKEINGVTISWSSSNPDVISSDGRVNREDRDITVTLTAKFQKDNVSDTKVFKVKVLKKESVSITNWKFTPYGKIFVSDKGLGFKINIIQKELNKKSAFCVVVYKGDNSSYKLDGTFFIKLANDDLYKRDYHIGDRVAGKCIYSNMLVEGTIETWIKNSNGTKIKLVNIEALKR